MRHIVVAKAVQLDLTPIDIDLVALCSPISSLCDLPNTDKMAVFLHCFAACMQGNLQLIKIRVLCIPQLCIFYKQGKTDAISFFVLMWPGDIRQKELGIFLIVCSTFWKFTPPFLIWN